MSQQTTAAIADDFKYNLQSFRKGDAFPYHDQIVGMIHGKSVYTINHADLETRLALEILERPDEALPGAREAVLSLLKEIHPSYYDEVKDSLHVQITGLDPWPVKRLDLVHLRKFVVIEGKVESIGKVRQVTKDSLAYFCKAAEGHSGPLPKRTTLCPICGSKEIKVYTEESDPYNQRFIEIVTDEGDEFGSTILVALQGKLVDVDLDLAETVKIGGIVRMAKGREKEVMADIKVNFLYVEANSVEHTETRVEDIQLSAKDRSELDDWKDRNDVTKEMVKGFAPHIFGENIDIVKECILYMGVGADVEGSEVRGDIHGAVIGDPSEGKTELSKAAVDLFNGARASGEGLNDKGIAVGLAQNKVTGTWQVNTGFMLRNKGVFKAIDEIDKLKKSIYLNELSNILESGEYILDRIIHRTFKTGGPCLVFGNPKGGKLDPYGNVIEQVTFPYFLLARFAFIWFLRQIYVKDQEQKRMDKIKSRIAGGMGKDKETTLDVGFMKKVVKRAKEIKQVTIEPEAVAVIDGYYHKMMEATQLTDYTGIPITRRQYEDMWRMAIARARLCLTGKVTKEDAMRIVIIFETMLSRIGTDVKADLNDAASKVQTFGQGLQDMTVLYGGKTQQERAKARMFKDILKQVLRNEDASEEIVVAELVKTDKFTPDEAVKAMHAAQIEGMIYQPRPGFWKFV